MKKRFDTIKFPKLAYVTFKKQNIGYGNWWVAYWINTDNRVHIGKLPAGDSKQSGLKKILELNYDSIE